MYKGGYNTIPHPNVMSTVIQKTITNTILIHIHVHINTHSHYYRTHTHTHSHMHTLTHTHTYIHTYFHRAYAPSPWVAYMLSLGRCLSSRHTRCSHHTAGSLVHEYVYERCCMHVSPSSIPSCPPYP
ncbi:hypothetical protein EON63_21545 [archaeon]|nr:MAG: hypothetical protein EON63_21545 [archaeon]